MKLMVTGGAGFIGSHFVNFLIDNFTLDGEIERIIIIDKLTYASDTKYLEQLRKNPKVDFFKVDICDRHALFTGEWNVDFIVNFAAESHVDRSLKNPQIFTSTNILGTCNLLDLILEGKADTLIQISTDEVYGSILKGSWTEDYNLQPNSPYSASKASADLLAMSYYSSFDLDVRITRASNNFGPRQHSEKMIPTIINSILRNNPIPVYGTGNQIRDWLHVQDHVQGIWQAIKHGKKGQVYNLGGGTELTNLDLIAEISKFFPERKILIEHVEDRKGHDFRYSLDFTKANQELGYSPGVTLQDGLAKTIEFYINASSIET